MNGAVQAMTSSLVALLPSADVSALGDPVCNISLKITTENASQAVPFAEKNSAEGGIELFACKAVNPACYNHRLG